MEAVTIIKETWLTRKPYAHAGLVTLFMTLLLVIFSTLFLEDLYNSKSWMPATGDSVFVKGEVWKLWTTLLAHGDLGHLLSNAFLFVPFTYLFLSYFSPIFFPLIGIAMGGLINVVVLSTMPVETALIGISGVVYWMGSAWLTLYFLIDRRHSLKRRFAVALFISVMLFGPEVYKPEISYLSHLVGYILGVVSGLIYFLIFKNKFRSSEIVQYIIEDNDSAIQEQDDVPHPTRVT